MNLKLFKRFFIFGGVPLLIMGCLHVPSPDVRHVVDAQRLMSTHPDSAIVLLETIDDSIICEMRIPQFQYKTICHYKAAGFVIKHQYAEAEKWLDKALNMESFDERWKQSYVFHRLLIQLEAVEKWGTDSIADSLRSALVLQMTDIPKSVPKDFGASEYEQRFINHPYYPIIVLLVTIVLLVVIWYDRKERRINTLHDSLENNEQQNEQLRDQIHHMQSLSREQLGIGRSVYENVRQGGTMKNISVADEQCFIDYYAFIEPKSFSQLMAPYKNLSLRHTTYLILCKMGYNDTDIQRILFVQRSTIRNYRLRIKKNNQ